MATKGRTKIRGFTVSRGGLNSWDLANEILTNLDGCTSSECKRVPKNIRRKLDHLIDELLKLVDQPTCQEAWVDVLRNEDPSMLIRQAKVRLETCMKGDVFPKCKIVKILLSGSPINLKKGRDAMVSNVPITV